ncbi:4-hydroxy-tetrahydrodipicolinate reductase [Candidatus Fukatsuia anoeciicola]|uniref:4-hydroxy-tetrahydrodipicolinate reductase n=1 Tax=Candidatus Fukatsuia anoeciicola TaxID=2994492 RepID=UPI003464D392
MIRIAIAGAAGRMGKQLIQAIVYSKVLMLTVALVRKGSGLVGNDAGKLAGIDQLHVIVSDDLYTSISDFDILIDFTTPQATLVNLELCRQHKKSIVIGTTNFNQQERKIIEKAAKDIAIIYAANFSIGVNLMLQLLEKTTKVMGIYSDIEIIETHHRHKVDAPSGTALAMGEVITQTLSSDLQNYTIYSHSNQKRKLGTIKFTSIRTGDVIGEHTVLFTNISEQIKITHKTTQRITFAHGAVKAAIWLKKNHKLCGLFNMNDVLGNKFLE